MANRVREARVRVKGRKDNQTEWNDAKKLFERQISEDDVVRQIMSGLAACGAKVYRHKERIPRRQGDKNLSTAGIPDLFGWIPAGCRFLSPDLQKHGIPIPLYIEVKKPGGEHRASQDKWVADAREDNVIAFFAESWADVQTELMKHGICLPN